MPTICRPFENEIVSELYVINFIQHFLIVSVSFKIGIFMINGVSDNIHKDTLNKSWKTF